MQLPPKSKVQVTFTVALKLLMDCALRLTFTVRPGGDQSVAAPRGH